MNAEFDPRQTPNGIYRPGKKRDENLLRIMDAAEVLFVEKGFRGASLQAIADAAGLPKANVHYYFRSKANLYQAVLDRIVEMWNSEFSQVSPQDDPAQALERFIREKVQLSWTHRHASKLFALEVISGAPYLGDYMQTRMRPWVADRARVIQQWIDEGKMAEVDPVQLIFMIWSTTQHYADFDQQVLTVMNKRDYTRADMQRVGDFLTHMILSGCGLQNERDK